MNLFSVPFALLLALPAGSGRERPPVSVQKEVYPFLKKHCVSCHNDADPRATRSLTDYQDAATIRRDDRAWREILRVVEEKKMPPANSPPPTAKEVERFVESVRRLRDQLTKKE